jgi:hypothetical protein
LRDKNDDIPVEHTRDAREEVRLHDLSILKELEGVTRRETDGSVTIHDEDLKEALVAIG